MSIDLEELAAIIRMLREAEFSEFRYTKGDVSLLVRRGDLVHATEPNFPQPATAPTTPPAVAPAPAAKPAPTVAQPKTSSSEQPSKGGTPVVSPLLGTFYSCPKPGEPPFVKVGDRVEPDTVVCIVEVMKLMNSVTAGVSGVVTAIHCTDGELVEHGQALFSVDTGDGK